METKDTGATYVRLLGEDQILTGRKPGINTANVKKKLKQLEREFAITPHPLQERIEARVADVAKGTENELKARAIIKVMDRLGLLLMKKPGGYLP